MLYAPCIIAIAVAGQIRPQTILLLVSITAFFFAHSPLFTLVRLNPAQPGSTEKFKEARIWTILYSLIAVAAGLPLLLRYRLWLLVPLGCVFAVVLAYQTYLTSKRSEKSMVGEFLAVISLTASAPATYYVTTKEWKRETTELWIFSILYFVSSIFFVKMLVSRAARREDQNSAAWQCALYHLLLALFLSAVIWWKELSFLVALGYVPIVLRSFWHMARPQKRLSLFRVGVMEIAYTILFVVFVSIGFRAR